MINLRLYNREHNSGIRNRWQTSKWKWEGPEYAAASLADIDIAILEPGQRVMLPPLMYLRRLDEDTILLSDGKDDMEAPLTMRAIPRAILEQVLKQTQEGQRVFYPQFEFPPHIVPHPLRYEQPDEIERLTLFNFNNERYPRASARKAAAYKLPDFLQPQQSW